MDLAAFLMAFAGAAMVRNGYVLTGAIFVAGPLFASPFSLAQARKPLLLLPLDFASWWVVMPLGFILTATTESSLPLGFALYYYGCIALVERKVRYAGGNWFGWYTVLREEQAVKYWMPVALVFALASVLLVGGLLVPLIHEK